VLVQDGRLVTAAPSSAQALLSQHGGGSYTTALVRGGHSVVDWQLHIQRLVRWG
jgi:branched-subunit amino acid aminotransferase/4-amino-4-deoxychorismate lyase